MIQIEHQVRIYRPLAEVFAFVGDPTNDVHWAGTVVESEIATPGPLGAGSRVKQRSKFLGVRTESTNEITVFEPNRRVCIGGQGAEGVGGTDCREFRGDGADTVFIRKIEVEVGNLFRMSEPLVSAAARRQIETDMDLLKTLMDARAEPTRDA